MAYTGEPLDADQRDRLRLAVQRQEAVFVLQQHGPFLGHLPSASAVGHRIDDLRQELVVRLIHVAELDHLDVPWTKQIVDVVLGHLTRIKGLLDFLLSVVLRCPVELYIRARLDGRDRVVNRATVTHDITVEAPVFAQSFLEQFRAVTGKGAVDIRERAHHRGWISILERPSRRAACTARSWHVREPVHPSSIAQFPARCLLDA